MLQRCLQGLSLALAVTACTQWHPIPRASTGLYASDRVPRAKLTLVNGATHELHDARIKTDSIVGTDPISGARAAFSIGEISTIASEEFSRSRTLLFASVLAATLLGIDLWVVAHTD